MDITVLSAIINIAWYIGTSLFLLFKFTSLFSYAINFSKFCWRLLTSVKYLSNLIFYKKKYTLVQTNEDDIEHQEISLNENKSFFSKIKSGIKKIYYKTYHYIFNKHHPNSIKSQYPSTPLTTYETTDSSMYINNSHNSVENQLFYQQLDNLNNSEYATQVTNNVNYNHRNYQNSYYNNTLGRSYLNKSYINQSLYHPDFNNTNRNYNHSNNYSNNNYNYSNNNMDNIDNMDNNKSFINQKLYYHDYNMDNMDNMDNIDNTDNIDDMDSDIKININLENENAPKNIFNIQDSNELFKSHFINDNLNNNKFTNSMPFAVYTQPFINENENLSNSTPSIYKDPLSPELNQYETCTNEQYSEDIPLLHDENYV